MLKLVQLFGFSLFGMGAGVSLVVQQVLNAGADHRRADVGLSGF